MKKIKFVIYLVGISLIFAKEAQAYIDPGTGSYVFQVLAASLLTLLFSAKKIFRFLSNLIKKLFSPKQNS